MECHEIESAVFAKERRVKNKTSLPRFDLKKYRVEEATAVVIVTVGDDRRVQPPTDVRLARSTAQSATTTSWSYHMQTLPR